MEQMYSIRSVVLFLGGCFGVECSGRVLDKKVRARDCSCLLPKYARWGWILVFNTPVFSLVFFNREECALVHSFYRLTLGSTWLVGGGGEGKWCWKTSLPPSPFSPFLQKETETTGVYLAWFVVWASRGVA
jgi:hypothetical protein